MEILCEFSCRFTQDFENVINLSMISLSDVPITPPKDLHIKAVQVETFEEIHTEKPFPKKF